MAMFPYKGSFRLPVSLIVANRVQSFHRFPSQIGKQELGFRILSYEPAADLARLAAGYAAALVRNHPFADEARGLSDNTNPLESNRFPLGADPAEAAGALLAVAAKELSEEQFAERIRSHMASV